MSRKSKKPRQDGRIKAEAPSRKDILSLLEDRGRPLQRRDIVERLNVVSDDSRETAGKFCGDVFAPWSVMDSWSKTGATLTVCRPRWTW
jgi:hypothetical protein